MAIADRYMRVIDEVAEQCRQQGRDPREVRVVAISKTVGLDGVRDALAAGASDFGENRPDQIMEKSAAYPEATWHFVGNIQSRRIADIVASAHLIHSLFELSHARKIDQEAARLGKVQDVLIEVNVSGEGTKSGVAPQDAFEMVQACAQMPHVRVRGLMTMAPADDSEAARATFEGLARLFDDIKTRLDEGVASSFDELSMGMSDDWREAIEAGATMIRIGRAIFSDDFE